MVFSDNSLAPFPSHVSALPLLGSGKSWILACCQMFILRETCSVALAESPHSGSNLHTSMKGFYVALRTTCGKTQVITLPLNYCIPPPKEQVKNFDSDIEQPMVFWICSSPCGLTFSCLGHLGNFALPAFFELSFSVPKIHFMAFFLSHCLCLHTSLHTHRYMHTCIAWMNTTLLSWKMQAPLS